ncbi:MAG: hypothetical protein QTN59_11470 [Candidatus Electrothrix communis]|nr:MAG: hypothetical protein QTN59_11470 [Candidatus Electrothrix communis]
MKTLFNHRFLFLFLYCLIMSCGIDLCWAADAVVLDVQGQVTVIAGNQTEPVHSGQALTTGDQLQSQGGTAKIIFADGQIRTLEVGKTLQIAAPPQTTQADSVTAKVIRSLAELTHKSQEPTRKATVRAALRRIPVSRPCNTAILPDKIRITWRPLPQIQSLELVLKPDSSSEVTSIALDPRSGEFTLSNDKVQLRPSTKYFWKLRGVDTKGRPYDSQTCHWIVLSDEQMRTLQEELHILQERKDISSKERDVLVAGLYLSYKLYDRASPLLSAYADDPGMKGILENIQQRD